MKSWKKILLFGSILFIVWAIFTFFLSEALGFQANTLQKTLIDSLITALLFFTAVGLGKL